jgi:hypothetical protein
MHQDKHFRNQAQNSVSKMQVSETSNIQLKLTLLKIQLTKYASFRDKHHAPTQALHIASKLLLNNTKIQFFLKIIYAMHQKNLQAQSQPTYYPGYAHR